MPVLHKLPSKVDRRCIVWGIDFADWMTNNPNSSSRAVSSHGMQDNPDGLADAKRGECICAMHFGFDPLIVLQWEVKGPDRFDLMVEKYRVDVKRTHYRGHRLIWPINKWPYYDEYQFDLLVLTKTEVRNEVCEGFVSGWCEKSWFKRHCRIADGSEHGITPGTPYIDEAQLDGMGTFPAQRPSREQSIEQAKQAIKAGKQFEFIRGRWP